MSTPKESPIKHVLYVIFGGLIGLAEMVPGVSGGTVALVVGIYERAIRNGDALLHTLRTAITDRSKLKEAAAKVEWFFLAAVGVGMIGTVLALSSVMHHFVDNHPETSRALFMGMVAVSILVPLNMIRSDKLAQHRVGAYIAFIVAAIATFLLTGVTSAEKTDPSLVVVFFAAMIAVCALVLPGVSGSFILLSLGLYSPVMGAVADRDLKVMAVFVLGAMLGVALFIKVLDYLITTHRTITLATMAGLMLGSLRALWPWQTDRAELLSPSGNVAWIVFMVILGGAIVAAIMAAEKFSKRH